MSAADTILERAAHRLGRRPLVLLLDVDGTLSPIAATPAAATVPAGTRDALRRIARGSGVHVALVSGRGARDARRLVGVEGVWAIGNHGFETISPDGELTSDPEVTPYREHVATAAARIGPVIERQPGTQLEDKGWTLSVHYRNAPPAAEEVLRPELERIARDLGLRLTAGKRVFELRPPVKIDKGTACLQLLDRLIGGGPGSVLYAGDDRTDEDAFQALRAARPDAVTIRIAPQDSEAPTATAAEFVLPDVAAMGALLERLAADMAASG